MKSIHCKIANWIPWYFPFGDTLGRLLHKYGVVKQNAYMTVYKCNRCEQVDATWDYHRIMHQ